jgi:YHS domain-containing protein
MAKVKDLVCGMTIDPQTAAATSEYKGQVYYFCAQGCKVAFDRDPDRYVLGEEESGHGG